MSDIKRSRAIRGGHRGVVTKLVRKAEEITSITDPLDSMQQTRLNVIKQQLEVKLNLLNDMDRVRNPKNLILQIDSPTIVGCSC